MALDDNTRFSITGYPGSPVELGEIELDTVGAKWEFGPAGGIWRGRGRNRPPRFGESYLELASISDLQAVDEIRNFVSRWGILGVRWCQEPRTWERLESGQYIHIFGTAILADPDDYDYLREKDREEAEINESILLTLESSQYAASQEEPPPLSDKEFPRNEETLAEFKFGAGLIRDFVRIWRWQAEGLQPEEWDSPLNVLSPPSSVGDATAWFQEWAAPLLVPFHPQFQIFETYEDGGVGAAPPYYANVSLLNVMALELYNHACERARFKVCANETCGRLFVRQEGRATHGQHRTTGVKYCSADCAKAQAQRQYRRRQRA